MLYEVYTYGAYNFILLFVILCTAWDDRSGLKHVPAVYWYVFNTAVCGGDSLTNQLICQHSGLPSINLCSYFHLFCWDVFALAYKRRPVCVFASEVKSYVLAFGNLFVQKCEFSGVVGCNIRVLFIFRCFYIGFEGGVGGRHFRTVLQCKMLGGVYVFLKRLK